MCDSFLKRMLVIQNHFDPVCQCVVDTVFCPYEVIAVSEDIGLCV